MIIPRYSIVSSVTAIEREFRAEFTIPYNEKWFNAHPGADLPVMVQHGEITKVHMMRWGLTPYWSKFRMPVAANYFANVVELLKDSRFRAPIRSKRCLVPANCFFLSLKTKKHGKHPYLVYVKEHRLFGLAGIWDEWVDKKSEEKIAYQSFSIIVGPSPKKMKRFSPYSPVIIHPEARRRYLSSKIPLREVIRCLRPYETDQFNLFPVRKVLFDTTENSRVVVQPIGERVFDEYRYKKSYYLKLEGMGGKHHDYYGQESVLKLDL